MIAVGDLLGDVFLDLKQPEAPRKLRGILAPRRSWLADVGDHPTDDP